MLRSWGSLGKKEGEQTGQMLHARMCSPRLRILKGLGMERIAGTRRKMRDKDDFG